MKTASTKGRAFCEAHEMRSSRLISLSAIVLLTFLPAQSFFVCAQQATGPDEISLREDLRVLRAIAADGAVPRATRAQATMKAMELGQQLQDHAVTREWALRFVSEYADTDAAGAHEAAMAYIWAGYKAEPDKTKRRERAAELLNYEQLPARTRAKIHV